MHNTAPHWSQTSARLLNECPRAWVSTYKPKTAEFQNNEPRPSARRAPRTFDDAMVQAMRSTWMERIRDQFLSKIWSQRYARQRLEANLADTMEDARMVVPSAHLSMGVFKGLQQLKALEKTISLSPLFQGQPHRWCYFERTAVGAIGGLHVYAAPDIAIYHRNKWTLIRLQFRSGTQRRIDHQLEHLLMVHWAMSHPGFPSDMKAYRVRIVQWRPDAWFEHNVSVSQQNLTQSLELVLHDIQEMKWIWRSATADPSLKNIPLARREQTCRRCRWRTTCPAKEGLVRAKERQEMLLANADHNEATRSARTA